MDYSLRGLYGNIYRDVPDTIEHLTFAVYRLDGKGMKLPMGMVLIAGVIDTQTNIIEHPEQLWL